MNSQSIPLGASQPFAAGSSIVYAGFSRRAVAFGIDSLIIASFIYVTAWGAASASGAGGGDGWQVVRLTLAVGFFAAMFPFIYFVFFHANGGQTPGKRALGIKVVGVDGREAGAARAVFRALAYPVSAFFMLGFLWCAFDRRSQGFHDKIAGTVVLEV